MSRTGQIKVIPATADQMPIVANLLQLYAHDFSEFHDVELGPDGRFDYALLPLYWSDPNRYPFLVRLDGQLAGFVLVKQESSVWDMVEFFVLRRYRRRGIGSAIAHEIWRKFPGPWKVRVMQSNHAALPFWERAISEFTGAPVRPVPIEKDGNSWHVFSFDSRLPR
ncbi:MAG: GNAT family N-acetyltransferase [Bryobacteraceae bacterium]|jgi:predicted acetyltransferase